MTFETELGNLVTTITPFLLLIGALVWAWFLRTDLTVKNTKINAIVHAARTEAIATDFYIRSMQDGTLTIEEGNEFKNKAAEAIVSHLTAIETITGKQVYNRPEVPLPLPVGGSRIPVTSTTQTEEAVIITVPAPEPTAEQPPEA